MGVTLWRASRGILTTVPNACATMEAFCARPMPVPHCCVAIPQSFTTPVVQFAKVKVRDQTFMLLVLIMELLEISLWCTAITHVTVCYTHWILCALK